MQCIQYVGSTSTDFKVRFHNQKSAVLTNKAVCEMAVHFSENEHDFDLLNGDNANNSLLTREAYWIAQLCTISRTISPYGLMLIGGQSTELHLIYLEIALSAKRRSKKHGGFECCWRQTGGGSKWVFVMQTL